MASRLALTDESLFAGRYRVRSSLGAGGMGAVYRVFDEMVGEEVALKILTEGDLAASERFRAEVRLARRITHRNVGRTFDIGTDQGLLFITMELIEGRTVLDWINSGLWSDAVVAWLASSAALGLAAAHHAEVVHRDLKPSNLLVTEDDRVVLIDWGIAAFRDLGEHGIAGTPDYMAPEQLLGSGPRRGSFRSPPSRCSRAGLRSRRFFGSASRVTRPPAREQPSSRRCFGPAAAKTSRRRLRKSCRS